MFKKEKNLTVSHIRFKPLHNQTTMNSHSTIRHITMKISHTHKYKNMLAAQIWTQRQQIWVRQVRESEGKNRWTANLGWRWRRVGHRRRCREMSWERWLWRRVPKRLRRKRIWLPEERARISGIDQAMASPFLSLDFGQSDSPLHEYDAFVF